MWIKQWFLKHCDISWEIPKQEKLWWNKHHVEVKDCVVDCIIKEQQNRTEQESASFDSMQLFQLWTLNLQILTVKWNQNAELCRQRRLPHRLHSHFSVHYFLHCVSFSLCPFPCVKGSSYCAKLATLLAWSYDPKSFEPD